MCRETTVKIIGISLQFQSLTEVHLPPILQCDALMRYTLQHREDAAGLISSRCNQDYNIIPARRVRVEPGGGVWCRVAQVIYHTSTPTPHFPMRCINDFVWIHTTQHRRRGGPNHDVIIIKILILRRAVRGGVASMLHKSFSSY